MLIDSNNKEIEENQINLRKFKDVKPIFEELIVNFPGLDTKDLIMSFSRKKEKTRTKLKENYAVRNRLIELIKQRREFVKAHEKYNQLLRSDIEMQKRVNGIKNIEKEDDYRLMNDELERLKNNKDQNKALRTILYNLYCNITSYILQSTYKNFTDKLGHDPLKKIANFNDEIFNNKLFRDLVKENIIKNALFNKEKRLDFIDGKLLRNTVVFTNYLVR